MSGLKANKSGVWTANEDKLLAEWQSQFGNKWAEVARQIPGKTGQQCAQRWRHRVNPDIRREKWGAEEDANLAALVQRHGNSWAIIARSMPGRTDQQCMGRWKRHLDPSIRREGWTPQEDALLFQLAEEYQNAWSAVSRGLTGRTPQQCRTRWHYISGNPNAAEASRAAIQAMRDAQAAAEAAKAGLKKRRGRPSKNALAAAAAGMLTVLAPLPKGTVVYHPRHDPTCTDAGTAATAPPATVVGGKRSAPARRPGRPPRKKVPAVEDHGGDYFEPAATTVAGGNARYSNQFDPGTYQNNIINNNNTDDNLRGSIDGEEAMLLDGFWNAVTAGVPPPASSSGPLDLAEGRTSGAANGGAGAVVTGRRNRPTRARISSRRRTSFSMSSEDEGSEEEEEDDTEAGAYDDEDDEDFVVKERQRYRRQPQQQRQQIWRPQRHHEGDDQSEPAAAAAAAAAGAGANVGVGVEADSDFEGEDETDNDEEYIPNGATGKRVSLHAGRIADGGANDNNTNDDEGKVQHHREEGYMFGSIRTLPVNQQHVIPMSPSSFDPSIKQLHQQHQQQEANTAAAVAAGNAVPTDAATTVAGQQQQQQQQHYFEEPALLLGSSRAERRVSLGDVPLSPAVFSPALTPPWSRRKRHNHARLAAFGPSVPTTGGPGIGKTLNSNMNSQQHGTPRRQIHHAGTAAAAALEAGAPLASPGILDLLHSPESFHHQRSRRSSDGKADVNDHQLGGHHDRHNDDGTGVGNHHHHQDDNHNEEDFFPGAFPESPALPQFAGLITPEWARAAAAASAAAEDAEVRRMSIASVARRLDVDSVAVKVAVNGATQRIGTGDSPPPQAGSLSVSLSLSAGGIPPAVGTGAGMVPSSRQGGTAITPAAAAAIDTAPGIEHTFFSPIETAAAAARAHALPPYSGTTTVPSSASHGRTFLAAALQRTVGSGLIPASGTFFPTCTAATAGTGGAGGHIAGATTGTGDLATPMAIEELLLTPMGLHIAGSNVPQVALTAAPPTGGAVPVVVPMMETRALTPGASGDGGLSPDVAAALQQAGLVALPAGQYNRVVLQNTTLTAKKDAPPAALPAVVAATGVTGPLSSSDVRMKLQALLEQV
ncbi:hypothetical protein Ndes2526B_g03858 [Nannochloris sp. 'desiccata']|nr:putative Transcription factor MYB3R-4 [Chlorella desiccata (nom. nud.)]